MRLRRLRGRDRVSRDEPNSASGRLTRVAAGGSGRRRCCAEVEAFTRASVLRLIHQAAATATTNPAIATNPRVDCLTLATDLAVHEVRAVVLTAYVAALTAARHARGKVSTPAFWFGLALELQALALTELAIAAAPLDENVVRPKLRQARRAAVDLNVFPGLERICAVAFGAERSDALEATTHFRPQAATRCLSALAALPEVARPRTVLALAACGVSWVPSDIIA